MQRIAVLSALIIVCIAAGIAEERERAVVRAQPANEPFTLTWEQQAPTVSPSARRWASMAYDEKTGTVLLFGGNDGDRSLGDTWRWDGTTWTELQPPTSPPARESAAMTSYTGSGHIVLFGGQVRGPEGVTYLDDTWTWDGATWTEATPAHSPSARSGASLAYDGVEGTLLLFGGADTQPLGDTWTWDGGVWTPQAPAMNPPARFDASMIWHSPTGTILLFGGNGQCEPNPCADTWVWYGGNGGSWGMLSPETRPQGRYGAGMALKGQTDGSVADGAGAVALCGGFAILGPRPGSTVLGGTQTFGDTWLWNGEGWEATAPATSPAARAFAAMAPNDANGSIVLFGGSGVQGAETVVLGDTWVLVGTPKAEAW